MAHKNHRFGGSWTEDKLRRVEKYLQAYTTALKKQPFKLMYVDAFAGTGYRTSQRDASSLRKLHDFPEVNDLAKGSARRALDIRNPFDSYVFIERNRNKIARLRELEVDYPQHKGRMNFECGDANEVLRRMCHETDWWDWRAVAFLDPYGTQVNWSTIEEIAKTKAIDLWYLFPSGMGVNRLLTKSGRINPKREATLDRLLGYPGWREVFYKRVQEPDLFHGTVRVTRKVFSDDLAEQFILTRMKQIFAGVATPALPLRNSKGICMYHLTFACGNPKGKSLALKLAEYILKE